nr:PREDICTED: uncharacterized protein LOC105678034 [Linepithema humile]
MRVMDDLQGFHASCSFCIMHVQRKVAVHETTPLSSLAPRFAEPATSSFNRLLRNRARWNCDLNNRAARRIRKRGLRSSVAPQNEVSDRRRRRGTVEVSRSIGRTRGATREAGQEMQRVEAGGGADAKRNRRSERRRSLSPPLREGGERDDNEGARWNN